MKKPRRAKRNIKPRKRKKLRKEFKAYFPKRKLVFVDTNLLQRKKFWIEKRREGDIAIPCFAWAEAADAHSNRVQHLIADNTAIIVPLSWAMRSESKKVKMHFAQVRKHQNASITVASFKKTKAERIDRANRACAQVLIDQSVSDLEARIKTIVDGNLTDEALKIFGCNHKNDLCKRRKGEHCTNFNYPSEWRDKNAFKVTNTYYAAAYICALADCQKAIKNSNKWLIPPGYKSPFVVDGNNFTDAKILAAASFNHRHGSIFYTADEGIYKLFLLLRHNNIPVVEVSLVTKSQIDTLYT